MTEILPFTLYILQPFLACTSACYLLAVANIVPQAILLPELPEGCIVKSSGLLWMMMVLPTISAIVKRSVKYVIHAKPSFPNRGGISPS